MIICLVDILGTMCNINVFNIPITICQVYTWKVHNNKYAARLLVCSKLKTIFFKHDLLNKSNESINIYLQNITIGENIKNNKAVFITILYFMYMYNIIINSNIMIWIYFYSPAHIWYMYLRIYQCIKKPLLCRIYNIFRSLLLQNCTSMPFHIPNNNAVVEA